jgi:hypothetical protein
LFPLFATDVIDTGANMLPVLLTPAANLPPVSTTVAKLMAKFPAGVVWCDLTCEYLCEFLKQF